MGGFERPRLSRDARHSVVYRNEQEFSSWPFYNGLWKLPNGDLLVGFKIAPCVYSDGGEVHHDNHRRQQGPYRHAALGATTARAGMLRRSIASWIIHGRRTMSPPKIRRTTAREAPVDFTRQERPHHVGRHARAFHAQRPRRG